jgi:hypothetical protein
VGGARSELTAWTAVAGPDTLPVMRSPCLGVACALLAAGCAPGPDLASPAGSRKNPVVCAGRPDEFAYLARLRCADGTAPHWRRVGDAPTGPYGAPLDRYLVRCVRLDWETHVYFDRRHRPIESMPEPDGFALAPARDGIRPCGTTDGCAEP